MHPWLGRIVDPRREGTLATRLRRQRFARFAELVADLPRPVRILDVGGVEGFWERMGFPAGGAAEARICLLNLEPVPVSRPGFESRVGDARDLSQFEDDAFDVVFSNSVIEHVGSFEDQARMAREVRRVGRRYSVQTPNRRFPIEAHTLVPGFQLLPTGLQASLLQRFALGWMPRLPDRERALAEARSLRLLTRAELARLFPDGCLRAERVLCLVKSWTVSGPVAPAGSPRGSAPGGPASGPPPE